MRLLKKQVLLRLVNSYIVDSPQPANISYLWNFGSLLGVCLILQILTGIFLAMHYVPNIDLAFASVDHIMRDVNNGWAVRFTHSNVASFFFIFVYAHIGRGLYYSSYKSPRVLVWIIGVIILIAMMATGFLGYVLPFGQMSLWGSLLNAPNAFLDMYFNFNCSECLGYAALHITNLPPVKIRAEKRIGPHNMDILSIIFGTLLGDGHAEKRANGTRIAFYQEGSHKDYLLWLHNLISQLGYCNSTEPQINTRLAVNDKIRHIIRFKTWTYSSFNWIYDLFYINQIKIVPSVLGQFLTPLALAIWIMADGSKVSGGLKLCTNSFSFADCNFLVTLLYNNFNLKASVQSAGAKDQYHIYIWKESMPLLREIAGPYVHSSMKYKIL